MLVNKSVEEPMTLHLDPETARQIGLVLTNRVYTIWVAVRDKQVDVVFLQCRVQSGEERYAIMLIVGLYD
jgi:hypothetical protein